MADAALTEACWTSANACANDGCAHALFAWANATSASTSGKDYGSISRERDVVHEEYARFIPLSTLVNMNACDYSTLRARYPAHLSAFDLSQFTAREFVEALGPGMIPRLLAIQREERLARQ